MEYLLFDNGSTTDTRMYLSQNEMETLSILSILAACISALGSGSVLACSLYHNRVCVAEIFPTFHLALADMMSSLVMILSSIVFLMGQGSYPGAGGVCDYIMPLVTSFYTSAVFLTITYAMEALSRFRKRLTDGAHYDSFSVSVVSNNWMYIPYIFSWIFPMFVAVVVMIVTQNLRDDLATHQRASEIIPQQCSLCFANFRFSEKYCWRQVINGYRWHSLVKLVFLMPLMLAMFTNVILYISIGRVYKQVAMRRGLLSYHQRQEENILKKKAMMYQGVFFLCWIPSIVVGMISFSDAYQMSEYYWLLLIQAILGPLHGVMNSLLYGWRRDSFRRALTESSSLLSTNRTMSVTL